MGDVLQVLHVRLFGWLPLLGLDEIDQIRVARLVMLGFELFSLAAIYGLARRLAEQRIALLAPLLYLSAGFVFQHGMSFRADPLVTALLLAALWLLLVSQLNWKALGALAVLLALAALATIKAVLFAPAFVAFAWYRRQQAERPRQVVAGLTAAAILAGALFAAMVWFFEVQAPPAPHAAAEATVNASYAMLLAEGLLPRWHYLLLAIGTAPLFSAALMVSIRQLFRRAERPAFWILLAGLILPLACVLFYRNAFPYFYAFILAPVAVGIVPGIAWLAQRYSVRSLALVSLGGCVLLSALTPRPVLDQQRDVLAAVHAAFPQPVPYFDFSGMVAAFPKVNGFMSTWGQTRYRNGEYESYRSAMARLNVPLLLANNDVLERNQSGNVPAWELLPEDAAAMRAGFIHHWGPIWVAGQHFMPGPDAVEFAVHAAGTYTLEGTPARIDGRTVATGGTITLSKGLHLLESEGTGPSTLRWGGQLPRPDRAAVNSLPFKDF